MRRIQDEVTEMKLEEIQGDQAEHTHAALLRKYTLCLLRVEWAAEEAEPEEVTVERPSDFGGTYKRREVLMRIRVPFTGDRSLLNANPGVMVNLPRAEVLGDRLEFFYQAASHELSSIRTNYNWDADLTKNNVARVNERVEGHNRQLSDHIRSAMEARRKKLDADRVGIAALGFNIRRHAHAPATYDFPIVQKTIQVQPPFKSVAIPEPDPAISLRIYDDILRVLADMSLAMERSPTAFARIQEEHLRDWFLVALNGHFHGDATGETFNGQGDTDIMIRVGGSPIFIAECKFWSGEKGLLETIDQLLGYLMWRDSKAALLIFSRNADFSAVLGQIPGIVGKHPHTCGSVSKHGESGFRFHLRDKTDPDRQHLVTLLAFNVPRIKPTSAA